MLLRDDDASTLQIRPAPQVQEPWPVEAELILSALDAAGASASVAATSRQGRRSDRRHRNRQSYRVRGELKFFSDDADAPPWILYTRNVTPRGAGFITQHRLPLGYGGKVTLTTPNGRRLKVNCTLIRCRETAPGWYEGALNFNRDQWEFQY